MNMNTSEINKTRKRIHAVTLIYLAMLVASKIAMKAEIIADTEAFQNVWWTALLIFGAMITGFLFQPAVKDSFPGLKDPKVMINPALHLKDHETLMGYFTR